MVHISHSFTPPLTTSAWHANLESFSKTINISPTNKWQIKEVNGYCEHNLNTHMVEESTNSCMHQFNWNDESQQLNSNDA